MLSYTRTLLPPPITKHPPPAVHHIDICQRTVGRLSTTENRNIDGDIISVTDSSYFDCQRLHTVPSMAGWYKGHWLCITDEAIWHVTSWHTVAGVTCELNAVLTHCSQSHNFNSFQIRRCGTWMLSNWKEHLKRLKKTNFSLKVLICQYQSAWQRFSE